MKSKYLLVLSLIVSLQSAVAWSSGGGTRGGEIVRLDDGHPELRDLVSKSLCTDLFSGDEIIERYPYIDKIIGEDSRLAKLDWYLASELRRELKSLTFCMTGKLIRVNTRDRESISAVYEEDDNRQYAWGVTFDQKKIENTEMIGIRVNRDVFIDEDKLKELQDYSPRSVGYFFIHEMMHSYFDWNLPMRNFKLRTAVRAISNIETKHAFKRSKLHKTLEWASAEFPTQVEVLTPDRDFVEFFTTMNEEEQNAFLASYEGIVSLFAPKDNSFWNALSASDQRELSGLFGNQSPFAWLVQTTCSDQNWEIFGRILEQEQLTSSNEDALIICLDAVKDNPMALNQAFERVRDHSNTQDRVTKLLGKLAEKAMSIEKNRIVANPTLTRLFKPASWRNGTIPVLQLELTEELPAEISGLIQLAAVAIRASQEDWVTNSLFGGTQFYQVVSPAGLLRQLTEMEAPIAREKTYVRDHLIYLHNQLMKGVEKDLAKSVGPEKAALMLQTVKNKL